MLGIMVGMDQKDKLLLAVACAQVVLLVVYTSRCVPSLSSASMGLKDSFMRDFPWRFHRCSSWARLSCPLCATTIALVQLLITVEVPQVQLIIKVIYIPVVAQSLIPMALTVQQTIEIPRLQFLDKVMTCPLLGHTGANCAAHLHGVPQVQLLDKVVVPVVCTTNALIQMRSTVEVTQLQFLFKVVIIPVGAQRQVPMVSLFSRPRRFSCCSTLTRCSTIWLCIPAGSSGAVVEKTV